MPAISMTMASMKSNAGENDSISIITQATAGVPSCLEGTTMLDLLSADEWTASLMCNGDYFFEATNSGVTTNKEFPTNFDTVEVSAYIKYKFNQSVVSFLTGKGPHLGWYLGNTDFKAKFVDTDGNDVGYKIHKPRTNGVFLKNKIVFMGDDPQVRVDLERPSDLANAQLQFEILYDVPEKFFRCGIMKYLAKRWITAAYRKFRTLIWKITHLGK